MSEEIAELFRRLEEALIPTWTDGIDPWNSNDEDIKAIWSKITAPDRLDDLIAWRDSMAPLNPTAEKVINKAIEEAKSRKMQTEE